MHIIKHFLTITKHRKEVRKLCFRCGLYIRGITHDLSKYSIVEFLEGAIFYNGKTSPITECKKKTGKSEANLHHRGRNPHHAEYWIDNNKPIMMPYQYAVESICDKIAAGKIYQKEKYNDKQPLEYWNKKRKTTIIHYKTKKFFDQVLKDLSIYGEEYILNKKYMQKTYNKICGKSRN